MKQKINTIVMLCTLFLTPMLLIARKKPKRPRPPRPTTEQQYQTDAEQGESHGYQPNPVVLTGVSQIVNGAINIAQNPHDRQNVGLSAAGMAYGIANIIIAKLIHKKIDLNDPLAVKECIDEICAEGEITEIITRQLLLKEE